MAFIGVLLALGSALLASATDVLRKRNSTSFDAVIATWALHGTTFLLALPVTALVNGIGLHAIGSLQAFARPFPVTSEFWIAFSITLVLGGFASFLWMRALAKADLSVAAPLSTLSPAFILLTAPFITGEIPSWIGVTGIMITTAGTFLLASPEKRGASIWTAFTGLLRKPEHRDLLIVALLYALAAPWEKRVVLAGGSLWYTVLMHGSLMLILFPLLFRAHRWRTLCRARDWPALLPFGFVNLLRSYAQFTALGFLPTFYVIGLKRSGALFGVLWGRLFFKEQETPRRMMAAVVMLIGAVLILWASFSH